MNVELVRLPEDGQRWDELREQGKARLALLADDVAPPVNDDPREDWLRLPATDADIRARMMRLQLLTEEESEALPLIDADNRLHVGDQWVALPPTEARLMKALIARIGVVSSRSFLATEGWEGQSVTRNALDTQMLRLRKRIFRLGLTIRTVRSRGYVLEVL